VERVPAAFLLFFHEMATPVIAFHLLVLCNFTSVMYHTVTYFRWQVLGHVTPTRARCCCRC